MERSHIVVVTQPGKAAVLAFGSMKVQYCNILSLWAAIFASKDVASRCEVGTKTLTRLHFEHLLVEEHIGFIEDGHIGEWSQRWLLVRGLHHCSRDERVNSEKIIDGSRESFVGCSRACLSCRASCPPSSKAARRRAKQGQHC